MIQVETKYKSIAPYLEYVFSIFLSIYKIPVKIVVVYGKEKSGDINILPSTAIDFFSSTDSEPKIYKNILWADRTIPLLFQKKVEDPIIQFDRKGNNVIITADILSSAFYFVSCWQEYYNKKKDDFGRFPVTESLLYKLSVLDIPVVNYYFDILATAIGKLLNEKPIIKNSFSTIITHDIDKCMTGWKENAFYLFNTGKILKGFQVILNKTFKKDIWFNFDKILKIEKDLNLKSTFFILTKHKKYKKFSNADYNLKNPDLQNVLNKIEETGSEIALHGSIGSGWIHDFLPEEIKELNRTISGNRFHYLAVQIPDSFEIIENNKLKYDSSLGFSAKIGFRSGICFPYKPFNFKTNKAFSFFEHPVMVMDTTLINKKYMGLDPEDSMKIISKLLNEVQKFNGIFVILWHNTLFSGYKYEKWKNLFNNIIKLCKEQNAVFLSAKEITDRYNSQNS